MVDHTSHAQEMRDAFVASMEWWEVAGVGEHVEDAPGAWLRSRDAKPEEAAVVAEKPAAQAPPQPPKRNAVSRFIAADDAGNYPGDPGSWPDDLEAFQKWWMESDAVDPPGSYPRVAPLGSVEAKAMIVLDQPEGEALLAGPASTLAANMLRAMGFAEDQHPAAPCPAARLGGPRHGRLWQTAAPPYRACSAGACNCMRRTRLVAAGARDGAGAARVNHYPTRFR